MEGFGERIRSLAASQRLGRGWQAELAARCGVKPPSVSGWLTGDSKKMDASHLFAAADFFRVNPRWLAFGIGPKEGGSDWPFPAVPPHEYYGLIPAAVRTEIEDRLVGAVARAKAERPPGKPNVA